MRICQKCCREFDEAAVRDYSPAEELADILLPSLGIDSIDDLCPDCREELGIVGLLGLSE